VEDKALFDKVTALVRAMPPEQRTNRAFRPHTGQHKSDGGWIANLCRHLDRY